VLSALNHPALADLPLDTGVELLVGGDLAQMLDHGERLSAVEAVVFIPQPGTRELMMELMAGGHLPNLRWAHCFYAGVDQIADVATQYFVPGDILLSNGRGAFSSSLAEYAMATALHFIKQVPRCMENRREKKWDKFVMGELKGRTLGLVGAGSIATYTARLAKAFGMRTVALRRNARKPLSAEEGAVYDLVLGPYDGPVLPAHKAALFGQSDVVVCTLPGTADTHHFVSSAEFAAMKPGSVFVSLGRGMAVDEAALDSALRGGRLGGAALDVFETEPLPEDSPLWDAAHGDRLFLTAHNADYTEDYFKEGWRVWKENYASLTRGDGVATPVDVSAGY